MSDTKQDFTPEQIAEFQAYKNYEADKKHAEASTAMYPAIGGVAGATVGAAIGTGNALVKGKNAAKELIDAAKAPIASVNVAGAPSAYNSTYGVGEGAVKNSSHNVDQKLKNTVDRSALNTKGYTAPGNSLILMKDELAAAENAKYAKATAEAEAKAASEAATKAKKVPARIARGVEALGPLAPILGKGLALGSAGYDIGDVIDRSNKGQYGRGVVSGLGALGSAAALAPNPIVKGLGMGVGIGAPMLNMYLDKKAQEYPEFFEKYNLAKGGAVPNLDTQTMAREILNQHLESKKPKPKPKFTIHTLPAGLSKDEFEYLCKGGHVEY